MSGSMGRQSIDDFLKAHRQEQASIDTTPPPPGYIDSAMGGGQKSYIDSVMSQGQEPSLIPLLQEAPKPEGPDWARMALNGLKAGWEMIEDTGKNLAQSRKYSSGPLPGMLNEEYTKDVALAQAGNLEAAERVRRGTEGQAFFRSTVAAESVLPGALARIGLARGVAPGVLRRSLAWLTPHEVAAGVYAATAPVAPEETREEIFKRAAWQFPAAGLVFHGLAKGLGVAWDRVFPKIDPEISGAMEGASPEQARDIAAGAREYARQVGPVPAAHAEDVAAEGVARATKDVLRLGMPPDEQMARNYDGLRRGEGKTHSDETVRAAALAEQMRGRPFTRVEFDNFIKDFGEDGPYMAMRKWAEPPGARRTSATAKAEAGVAGEGPDFVVEDLEPPPPPTEPAPLPKSPSPKGPLGMEPLPPKPVVEDIPEGITSREGLREDLGTPSEAQLQQELETLVPKPKARGETEAEARARVEEARRTPFPGTKEPPWAPLSQEASPAAAASKGTPLVDYIIANKGWTLREIKNEFTGYPKNKQAMIRIVANADVEREGLAGVGREPPYAQAEAELNALFGGGPKLESYRTPGSNLARAGNLWDQLTPDGRAMAFKAFPGELTKTWAEHTPGRQAQLAEVDAVRRAKLEDLLDAKPGTVEGLLGENGGTVESEQRVESNTERMVNIFHLHARLLRSPSIGDSGFQVVSRTLGDELQQRIASSWYAKDLSEALNVLKRKLVTRMRTITPIPDARFGGLGVEGHYLGLNVWTKAMNDFVEQSRKVRLPYEENVILYNPFGAFADQITRSVPLGKDLATALAEDTWGTMLHEVAHQKIRGETPEHVEAMRQLIAASEKQKSGEVLWLRSLWEDMLKDDMFQRHALEVYDEWAQHLLARQSTGEGVDVLGSPQGRLAPGGEPQPSTGVAEGGGGGGAGLEGLVESGSTEPPGDYASVFGDRPYAGGEDLEGLLAKRQHDPGSVPDSAIADASNEAAIQNMTPEEMLEPQEKVEAAEAVAELPHEPTQRQPLTYLRQVGDEPAGAEMDSEPGAKSDEALGVEEQKGEDFWKSDEGKVSARVAARIALLGLSGISEYAAGQTDDPTKERYLHTLAGFLAMGALGDAIGSKGVKAWLQRPVPLRHVGGTAVRPLYGFVKSFDLPRIMTDGSVKAMDAWHGATQWGRAGGDFMRRSLEPHFPDVQTREAGMYSIDEGSTAPEWHTLNPQTKSEVAATSMVNGQMLSRMEAVGAIPTGSGRAWYISKLFSDREIGHEWYSKWENLVQFGTPAQAQAFATVRAAINWAQTMGRDLPVMDPVKAQPHFVEEVSRQMANHGLVQGFKSTGVLVPFDRTRILNQSPHMAANLRLRQVRAAGLGPPQMATDEAATLIERAYGARDFGGALAAVDKARGVMMRSIMFWAWEHGINGMRSAFAAVGNPAAYAGAIKALRARDPGVMEFSKFADPFQRTDWGPEAQNGFDKMMENLTKGLATRFPTLARIGATAEHWRAASERALWNDWIPAIGYATWTREMKLWTDRTGGRYLTGSPEYNAMAKRVGELANDAMGKVPKLLVDPKVGYLTRLALFSPNWTRTRLNLTAKAGVEATRLVAGELPPQDALYLPFALRKVLIGVALAAVGSLVLTGIHGKAELPQFNPNTNKFYMRTGMYDRSNREIGVDLAGWYQDDAKLFNDPFGYLRDRSSPLLRTAFVQTFSRDVFGRSLEGAARTDAIIQAFGPPGELVSSAGKLITQGMEPAEIIRGATGVAAVGNVSALPTMRDANAERLARKILQDQGLPADKDRVYELGILLKRNSAQHVKSYGGDVPFWIASQKRQYQRSGWPWLWDQKKRDLRNFLTK